MPILFFALVSYFAWGVGTVFEAVAARRINSYSFVFWAAFLSFIIFSFIAPFFLQDLANITFPIFLLCIFLGFFLHFGALIYYEAIQRGNPSIVGVIASSYPAVIVIISIAFLGEKISFIQTAAILLIFLGIFLSCISIGELKKKNFKLQAGFILAIITMISWGIFLGFIQVPVKQIGWFWPNYFAFLWFPFIYLYIHFRKIKLERPTSNKFLKPFILSVVLVRIAEFSYNYAVSKGVAALIAPIAGAAPTLYAPLSYLVFREKITKQQIVAVAITLIGIVFLAFVY